MESLFEWLCELMGAVAFVALLVFVLLGMAVYQAFRA